MTRGKAPFPPLRFRGWAVVAGSFVVQAISFGAIYSFPAFAGELSQTFGTHPASLNLIYAVSGAMAFAVGALSGPVVDRFGACWPVSAGMAFIALGFLLATRADSFLEVLLCYGLMVGLGAGLAYVPALAVVQHWFVAWRGLASGLATAGVGAGTAMVPLAAPLLVLCGGWREAFAVIGIGIAVLGLLAAQLLDSTPERCGLWPDGGSQPGIDPATHRVGGVPAGEALTGRRFAWLMAGCLLVSGPIALPYAEIVPSARLHGMAPADALWLVSLIGLGSILGRLALGAGADRLGRIPTLLICCTGVAASMAGWAGAQDARGFVALALAFGIAQGGFVALLPCTVVDLYGRRSAGSLLGALFLGRALAVLIAPPGLALLSQASGPVIPLWAAGGCALLGTAALALGLRQAQAPDGRAGDLPCRPLSGKLS